ncbi:MAG: alpha-L-rhamnosidase [Holophagaceae bacterium]|nr:alpha-L-rhamnosidase [Holophagaceae bacterium]
MNVYIKYSPRLAALAGAGALALLTACGGSSSGTASVEVTAPWPAAPTTVEYASRYGTLLPAKVLSSSGVTTPGNATTGDTIILTFPEGGTAPSIVLDYGKLVGGYPQFEVDSVIGDATLKSTFSESLPYVNTGDQPPYLETAFEPSRALSYALTPASTGKVRNQLLQGGERYQKLTLTTPGTSVILRGISLDATLAYPNVSADAAGYFSSSDTTLNAIWNAGAYSCEANRIDAVRLPSPWTLSSEGVQISPSNPAVYQGMSFNALGSSTSFYFRVDKGGVSWTVNATFPDTVQFTLHANTDTETPNYLTGSVGGSFSTFLRTNLAPVNLADQGVTLKVGEWHKITTVCDPSAITHTGDGLISVVLDDTVTLVSGLDPAAAIAASGNAGIPIYLGWGSSGFFSKEGHLATVKNFNFSDVLAGGHAFSYSASFTDLDTSVLDDFGVGTNQVAVITDGARRDRQVWSGDMRVWGPSLYYTTGDKTAANGSLTLFSKYVDASGQTASVLPPQSSIDVTSNRAASPGNPWYSLGYSMYFIDNLYDYYLHTGDKTLVSDLWSIAQGELAYLASQQDSSNLLNVNSLSGFTWHPQFDAVYGAGGDATHVSEFNLDYVQSLKHASALATALEDSTSAASYLEQADLVAAAINANLRSEGGLYEISNTRTGYTAQDANAKAVLYGVAPSTDVQAILDTLTADLGTSNGPKAFSANYFTTYNNGAGVISPYISNWEVLARLEQGDTAGALDIINKLWGRMVAEGDYYSGATWESLDASTGNPVDDNISLAHAWSSGPTAALSKYVLGVRPVTPGFQTWKIQPQMGTLSWASGRVPTPYGALTFKWAQSHDGVPFMAELVVPTGTTGTLNVPVVSGATVVRVNGSKVTPGASFTLGGVTYLPVTISASGSYSITVKNS